MALLDAHVMQLVERVGFIFNYFRDQRFTFLADIILGFSTWLQSPVIFRALLSHFHVDAITTALAVGGRHAAYIRNH